MTAGVHMPIMPSIDDRSDITLSSCPLCGGARIGKRYRITRYDPALDIDACADCGFLFRNPRPSPAGIEKLYREGYYTGECEYAYCDERRSEGYARHVWEKRVSVLRHFAPPGNILDVGASFGGLLRTARPFFAPHGIELSSFSGAHAKKELGDAMHIGTLEDHPFPKHYFSAITMIELIEHLPAPLTALRECYDLLIDGGVLVIQTANMAGFQARLMGDRYAYFMPGHLSYFSKRNLIAALARCGFGRVRAFHPVEFGLLPKLKKSRGNFRSLLDYRSWARIAAYHWLGKIHWGDYALTSSMVLYAFKTRNDPLRPLQNA